MIASGERLAIIRATVALVLVFSLAAPAAAQPKPLMNMSCKQLWDDADTQADHDADHLAIVSAGQAPSVAARDWATRWRASWKKTWSVAGGALPTIPGQDCCKANWYEHAAQTGKDAWDKAMAAVPLPTVPGDRAWAQKYAQMFADSWARVWFERFPIICARAMVDAAADALAKANADALAGAWALADAVVGISGVAEAMQSSWKDAWGEAGSVAWATAGAQAEAQVAAAAQGEALAYVSGNCAIARSNACAQAAAAAFAAAWSSAGASSFADAYADAWAYASATAFMRAFAFAFSRADAVAFSQAMAQAWASAFAQAYADAVRKALADHAQLDALVKWWTTPGAPRPPLKTIQQLLARASGAAFKSQFKNAFDSAFKKRSDWDLAFKTMQKQVAGQMSSWSSAWVSTWASRWAYAWATTWAETYVNICSKAAAAACAQCPCPTGRTVSRPTGFTYTLVGLGVSVGQILEITFTSQGNDSMLIEVPGGTVFIPNDPDYQRVVTDHQQLAQLAPGQNTRIPLDGYCLDRDKQPPATTALGSSPDPLLLAAAQADNETPPGMRAALRVAEQSSKNPKLTYQISSDASVAPFARIVEVGNRLADQGAFHADLPARQYRQAVIQRALWTYSSRGTKAAHTRDTIVADLKKQVQESGGKQTDADINKLADHLWQDVQLVLQTAGMAQ
jgi:hypothetical protein